MTVRKITTENLTTLRWIDVTQSQLEKVAWTDTSLKEVLWRIVADITCSSCGAYQAADSDPTNDKQVATVLTLGLFDRVGWRIDEKNRVLCEECAHKTHE